MSVITYSLDPELTASEFIDVLVRSTLSQRRPVDDLDRIERMLLRADVILTARNEEGLLVGVSRSISDGAFCTYLSDLAVDEAYQGKGIGKELIARTHEAAGHETLLILLAAPPSSKPTTPTSG